MFFAFSTFVMKALADLPPAHGMAAMQRINVVVLNRSFLALFLGTATLFAAAADTLLEFGRNPRWLGGEIAATLVLHTWGQTLSQHLHLHCLVAAGALDCAGQ